jgi:cation diffusion facilitator family transporter
MNDRTIGAEDRSGLKTAAFAVFAGLAIMGLKFFGYRLTGSSALLSDALESIINVAAGAFALFSVWVASRPPDEDHPYGHGKMEFFSAGFEGALVVIASIGVFIEGTRQIINPQPLPQLDKGIAVSVVAALANLALGLGLMRKGRTLNSEALVADGKHLITDVITSAGMVIGLALTAFTDAWRLDGAVACVMGCNILFVGFRMVKTSFLGLMDASDPQLLERICDLLSAHRNSSWIDIHKLRAWRSGARIHVDFHLILPGDIPLEEAHAEVKSIEEMIARGLDRPAEVLVHLDPCVGSVCPICGRSACDLRKEAAGPLKSWDRRSAVLDKETVP